MYISFALGLIANAKQRKHLVEYRLNLCGFGNLQSKQDFIETIPYCLNKADISRKNHSLMLGYFICFLTGGEN